jgi:hypothetical protein
MRMAAVFQLSVRLVPNKRYKGRKGAASECGVADRQPDEVSWKITKERREVLASLPMQALAAVSERKCLPRGQYEFVLRDAFGDGICCGAGQGHFAVKVDGREILHGGCFQKEKRYRIQVAPRYERDMSDRARAWLVGHNDRRRKYHREFGASYVTLQWSLGGTRRKRHVRERRREQHRVRARRREQKPVRPVHREQQHVRRHVPERRHE